MKREMSANYRLTPFGPAFGQHPEKEMKLLILYDEFFRDLFARSRILRFRGRSTDPDEVIQNIRDSLNLALEIHQYIKLEEHASMKDSLEDLKRDVLHYMASVYKYFFSDLVPGMTPDEHKYWSNKLSDFIPSSPHLVRHKTERLADILFDLVASRLRL